MKYMLTAAIVLCGSSAVAQTNETPLEFRAVEKRLNDRVAECTSMQTHKAAAACTASVLDLCLSQAPHADTTMGMMVCGGITGDALDRGMNAVWKHLKRGLGKGDFENLLSAQRDWLGYRDREARAAAKEYEGGSMSSYTGWFKYDEMTGKRLADLIEMKNGL